VIGVAAAMAGMVAPTRVQYGREEVLTDMYELNRMLDELGCAAVEWRRTDVLEQVADAQALITEMQKRFGAST